MAKERSFKIVIVGGGIAGLVLAKMLERFDIDYVLLEGRDEVAPPVGASIGLMPNGLLILDQLGCYEAIAKAAQGTRIDEAHTRSSAGKSLGSIQDFLGHVEQRHGYPLLFFDRQWALQALYDQLQYKERVRLRSKVDKIEQLGDCISATTTNGEVHIGNILVGADGIHSIVRREMRRLADSTQPGTFLAGEEDQVPCYYQCSFGIAQHVDGWIDGEQAVVMGHGQSFLVVSGPNHRVYWFLFNKLPDVKRGSSIPRYTKDDEEQFMKDYGGLQIKENITFGQVYDKRLNSTLTPLHEVVYKKWFFQRIVLMGDSVHKPNPIGGQGGNGAIESAAEFVNALLTVRDKRAGGLDGLTVDEIESISHQMQEARHERAKLIVKSAHSQQALFAFENPALSTLVLRIIAPRSPEETVLTRFAQNFRDGARLESLPVPARPRIIPFNHELPAKPLRPSITTAVRIALTISLGFVLFVSMRKFEESFDTFDTFRDESGSSDGTMLSFWRSFPSFSVYNGSISDTKTKFQLAYILSQLASPTLIYTIEGYRRGNQGMLLALPSVLAGAIIYQGIGRVAVAYVMLISWQSFQLPTGRKIPVKVARSMGPALVISYIIPLMVLFLEGQSTEKWEFSRFICPFCPLSFTLLVAVFSLTQKREEQANIHRRQDNGTTKESATPRNEVEPLKECYLPNDVPILQSLYWWIFIQQSLAHFALVAYGSLNFGISLTTLFSILPSSFATPNASSSAMGVLEYDMTLASLGFLAQIVYSLWNLRYLGYVTTLVTVRAAIGVMASCFFLGPSATLAGFWIWRERILSNLSTYPY